MHCVPCSLNSEPERIGRRIARSHLATSSSALCILGIGITIIILSMSLWYTDILASRKLVLSKCAVQTSAQRVVIQQARTTRSRPLMNVSFVSHMAQKCEELWDEDVAKGPGNDRGRDQWLPGRCSKSVKFRFWIAYIRYHLLDMIHPHMALQLCIRCKGHVGCVGQGHWRHSPAMSWVAVQKKTSQA